jgi:hypothetical protein
MRRVKDLHAAGRPSDAKLIHLMSSGIKVGLRPSGLEGREGGLCLMAAI